MKVIDGDRTVYVDVDETLVFEGYEEGREKIIVNVYGSCATVYVNDVCVDLIKIFKQRGYTVVVWSQSGVGWAAEIVRALGLSEFVDVCITKPTYYIDDLDCSKWMVNHRLPYNKKQDA